MTLVREHVMGRDGHFRRVPYAERTISYLKTEGCSEAFLYGIAKGPWSVEWARREALAGRSLMGMSAYEAAPDPPDAAVFWAEDVASQLKRENKVDRLEQVWQEAARCGFDGDPETLGKIVGLAAAGDDLLWRDLLPGRLTELIVVPRREFHA